ncbi:MAG: hypothetical protein NVSMB32_02990 [Actinomycetota bacterium]
MATLLRQAIDRGLLMDLTGATPRLSVADDLPRGSLLICWQDGRQEQRSGLTNQQMGYVVRTALATAGR